MGGGAGGDARGKRQKQGRAERAESPSRVWCGGEATAMHRKQRAHGEGGKRQLGRGAKARSTQALASGPCAQATTVPCLLAPEPEPVPLPVAGASPLQPAGPPPSPVVTALAAAAAWDACRLLARENRPPHRSTCRHPTRPRARRRKEQGHKCMEGHARGACAAGRVKKAKDKKSIAAVREGSRTHRAHAGDGGR